MSKKNSNNNQQSQQLHSAEHHDILLQLEALIFASDTPVSLARLKEAFAQQFTSSQLRQYLQQLAVMQHGRSIELVETAQGYRFQVRAKYKQMIIDNNPEQQIKLSPSLLEILAVIAYHQPITRSEIEQIRGVANNSNAMRTLFDWGWIKESGHRELPGRPALLVTTPYFLNAFGVTSLADLPPLAEKEEFNTHFAQTEVKS